MNNTIRNIALLIRRRSKQKEIRSVLRDFDEWRMLLRQLTPNTVNEQKMAIVRLDDIGDYLLWRNYLSVYKQSELYKDCSITLIGNVVWKSIFDEYDAHTVDETIWVDKHQYFDNPAYRMELWQHIRTQNFTTIICPSRTRPLLLDDLVVLASGAKIKIASHNSFVAKTWNRISDSIYTQLFAKEMFSHEFVFNRKFAEHISGQKIEFAAPYLPLPEGKELCPNQILCFIGASAKSKTWPVAYWIELLHLLQQQGFSPILSAGKNEMNIAEQIVAATAVRSIVGQTNLVETMEAIASSEAIITGDTMAAHAAVSYRKPTVILANGVNAIRFVAYQEAGIGNVKTIYTQEYMKSRKSYFYRAVTKDMQSIKSSMVLKALKELLR